MSLAETPSSPLSGTATDKPFVIAATFTAEPIADSLEYWFRQLGFLSAIRFAAFNQVFQELLDPSGLVGKNRTGTNLFLLRLSDWLGVSASDQERTTSLAQNLHDFHTALRATAARGSATNLVLFCPCSPSSDPFRTQLADAEKTLLRELSGITGAVAISSEQLERLYPVRNGYDAQSDAAAHLPYTPELFAALGTIVARTLDSLHRARHKVIVLDCDQTLWRGVVGEDGPQGVELDAARRDVQIFMRRQREAGRLLCLCSKNEEADVAQVFAARPEFPLQWTDFVAHRINWKNKSANLRALAKELNVGLDSFIFVDDNPAECAEVRAHCPDVLVLELPENPARITPFLHHVWALDFRKVTAEDRQRTAMYQQAHQRAEFQKSTLSFDDFLAGLQLVVDIHPATPAELPRVIQLTERTNQFNFTTIRLDEVGLNHLLSKKAEVWSVQVRDRFGDYGLVGTVIFQREGDQLTVLNLLLSCRVLGRGVEHQIIAKLGQTALEAKIATVVLSLIPTKKNTPAQDFLRSLGEPIRPTGASGTEWRLPAANAATVVFFPPSAPIASNEGEPKADVSSTTDSTTAVVPLSFYTRVAETCADAASILKEITRERRHARPSLGVPFLAARNAEEQALAEIWEEVLGLSRVGINDDFFELGGDSIRSIQIISKANQAGLVFTLRQQFEFPTIASLVPALARAANGAVTPAITDSTPSHAPALETPYPLGPMQQGMLFETLQSPDSGVCFEQDVYVVQGSLDVTRFESAWREAVARHPILRTTFRWEALPAPEQRVHASAALDLRLEDWSTLSKADETSRLQTFMSSERQKGFDLTRLPLMRLGLIRTSPNRHFLVWSYHHILLDGWSLPNVLRDVLAHYAGQSAVSRHVEPRPYRDYIAWLSARDRTKAESFWRTRLKGFTSPTPLTVDRRSSLSSNQDQDAFRRLLHRIPQATIDALQKLARGHRVTLNTLFQGAWALLLGRYAAVDEVVYGCNLSGRSPALAGVEHMVGLFINTLPLRISTAAGTPLRAWLQSVQERVLELQEHESDALPDVQKWSDIAAGRQLFESIFVFANYPLLEASAAESKGLSLSHLYDQRHTKTGYPLTLVALPGSEGWLLEAIFDTSRFDEATVNRLLGHYQSLLSGFVAAPESNIETIPLLTSEERSELITAFNQPVLLPIERSIPLDGNATLHELFERQVARAPDAIAITCEGQSWSYRQLNAQANRLAHRLGDLGIGPDVLVGICMERSNDLVAALLGILKAGGAYLPIDLAYPADRLAFMLEDAKAPVLLTQLHLAERLPKTTARVVFVDELLKGGLVSGADENLSPRANPENLAYVIYTSGTTGKPKGSQITHRNVARLFSATDHWYGFNEHDTWTLFHSYAFDFSVWEIWGAVLYGGRLVVVPYMVSRSPEAFYELLAAERVTVLNQTPSAFRQLMLAEERVGQKPLALRYVIFGGEALEMQSLRPWFDRHGDQKPQLVNMYGITETTVHVTYRAIGAADLSGGSVIGVPIPDLQIYILDPRGEPVPIGVPGEMYVGGAGLARGYLYRPDLTADRFIPDKLTGQSEHRLYRTGDLARFLPGRDIEYLGRIDHQVKIRGFRIELGEIESVLCQHARVREVIVLARSDVPGEKRLVAYVIADKPVPSVSDLRDHLKQKLPDYMVPAAFVFLDKLPLTTNGKVDRQALPIPELDRPKLADDYVAARDPIEVQLAALWSRLLRVERVGVHDNIFELGANSMLLVQAHAPLKEIVQRGIRIIELFQYPTIHSLLKHLRETKAPDAVISAGKTRAELQKKAFAFQPRRTS